MLRPGSLLNVMFWVWMTLAPCLPCQQPPPPCSGSPWPRGALSCSSCRLSMSAWCCSTWLVGIYTITCSTVQYSTAQYSTAHGHLGLGEVLLLVDQERHHVLRPARVQLRRGGRRQEPELAAALQGRGGRGPRPRHAHGEQVGVPRPLLRPLPRPRHQGGLAVIAQEGLVVHLQLQPA